jgi:hypothetical protein
MGVSSCGNHVERARKPQCTAGKTAVNDRSTGHQLLCIE